MNVTVQLDDADTRYGLHFRAVRGIDVEAAGYRGSRLLIDNQDWPLIVLPRPHADVDLDVAVQALVRMVSPGHVGIVVAASVPLREREALERAGLAWCDGRGAAHIEEFGVLIHIDVATRKQQSSDPEATKLGPAGIRALQTLVSDPNDEWTVSRLHREAAISIGQAHNVFRALEAQRLVTSSGAGPMQRRAITDRGAAMDWLAELDRRRRRPQTATGFLYARSPGDLIERVASLAIDAGLPYAFTAAAGASLLKTPVLTQSATSQIRIGVLDAPDALEHLGMRPVHGRGSGANVELWTDTGELGTHRPTDIDGVKVAPSVRVWLDLARQGGRNADAAQLFREHVLEPA